MKKIVLAVLLILVSVLDARADLPLPAGGWEKVLNSPASLTGTTTNDEEVYAFLEHKGILYIGYYTAGLPNSKRAARLYTWDGQTQTLNYTFGTGLSFNSLQALGTYQGKIYAALSGLNPGDGDIYVSTNDGTTWTKSLNATSDYFCSTLVTFKDKLYAGMGYLKGRIMSFDGSTWRESYPGKPGSTVVEWMTVYRGKLYAALGGSIQGRAVIVSTSDGINWAIDYDNALASNLYSEAAALVEFRGRLYAGMLRGGTTGGDVLVRDDATGTWSVAWSNPNGNRIHALEVYNGRLYVGNANMVGAGDVYVSDDGINFAKDLDTAVREVFRLYPYKGSLYMGAGFTNGQAQIWRKTDQVALRLAFRKLAAIQNAYTRNLVISTLSDLEDRVAIEERLLRHQDDVAGMVVPYYGGGAGSQLAALLREHITIAKEAIIAAKENNAEALTQAQNRWIVNADAIAVFLNGLNDHWSREDLRDKLCQHVVYVIGMIQARLAADWVADIGLYDKDSQLMLLLSDMIADGIVNQFPDKFKK